MTTISKSAAEMTVVELRNYAQSLGIKNVKNYKKEELLAEVENRLMNPVEENPIEVSDETIELPVANWDYDTSLTMTENIEKFYSEVKDMNLTADQLTKIFFEKAEEKGFSVEQEDEDKFAELYSKCFQVENTDVEEAKVEETKNASSEEKSSKKTKKSPVKRIYIPKEKPDLGSQSRQIYDMILQHPSWSHYKIATVLNCTYTNVRRVFLSYIKNKNIEGYKDTRSDDYFKKVKRNK